MERLPERVVFDTSIRQIAPPPKREQIERQTLQSAFAFEQLTPGPLPTFSKLAQLAKQAPIIVERNQAAKVAGRRTAPRAHNTGPKIHNVREVQPRTGPPIRTTLLENISGLIGQMFKVN